MKSIKEIIEQEVDALWKVWEIQQKPMIGSIDMAVRHISDCVQRKNGKVVTSGMGKAGEIAHTIATTFCSTGIPSVFLHPGEAQHGDMGVIQKNDILLLVSNSGETKEIVELVTLVKELDVYDTLTIIAITGKQKSTLAKNAQVVIWTGDPKEVCPLGLTPTTSTTVMSVIGDILVVQLMEETEFTAEQYYKRHHSGYLGEKAKGLTAKEGVDLILRKVKKKGKEKPVLDRPQRPVLSNLDYFYNKAKRKERAEKKMEFCISQMVCPICGSDMLDITKVEEENKTLICKSCDFTYLDTK
jgi:arabinose-5-phosphate isomerase